MSNFFSNIQHYLSSVATAISATFLVIFPFTKPLVKPTPTPVLIQEVKGINALPTPTPEAKKIILISKPTPTPTPTPLPSPTPVYQAPQVSLEALCKGYTDELRATARNMVGSSIYNSNPYYELTNTRFYNYCLANNGNTSGFKVESPSAILITPTPAPVIILDNSAWIQSCIDSVTRIEADKQKAVNEAIGIGQNECTKRGYSPPDYTGCEGYIQAQIDKVAPFYDGQIRDFKLSTGCL